MRCPFLDRGSGHRRQSEVPARPCLPSPCLPRPCLPLPAQQAHGLQSSVKNQSVGFGLFKNKNSCAKPRLFVFTKVCSSHSGLLRLGTVRANIHLFFLR